MEKSSLDILGKSLVKYVRDETIHTWEGIFEGSMKGVTAEKVREKIGTFNEEQLEVLKWIVPKIVDEGLHNLLNMFEESEDLVLGVKSENGEIIDVKEESDGLAGELYTEDGWITRFTDVSED